MVTCTLVDAPVLWARRVLLHLSVWRTLIGACDLNFKWIDSFANIDNK